MRVFVTGVTEALGAHLVPGQVAADHEVTVTTWTPGNVALLRGPRAPAIWPVARAGTRQAIAQGHITVYESPGGPVKADQDPLDSRLIPSAARLMADHIWRYANWREGFRAWVSG